MDFKIDLETLKSQLGEAYAPWVDEYGKALLQMTADEIKNFILLALKGDVGAAFAVVLEKMDNAELLTAGNALHADWTTSNVANKQRLALQRRAAEVAVQILLTILLAAIGF